MPDRLIPPGYRAELIGSATTLEELSAYAPMEEAAPEGSLMLLRLDLVKFLGSETLAELEKALRDKGVPPWPDYPYVVYADATAPSIYIAWQKGIAWTPIIIGILVLLALPFIGMLFWRLLPEALKDLISMFFGMIIMLIVLRMIIPLLRPPAAPRSPRELEEPRR